MTSTTEKNVSSSASVECKNHAQELRKNLGQLSRSLQKKGERLRSLNGITTQTKFLNAIDVKKLLNSWERIFGQVVELDFEIKYFVEDKTPVTVVVAGGFSAGKSTFLNGLIGIDLLEIADGPASKRIVNIKYGSVESYFEMISPANKGESTQRRQISKEELKELQLNEKTNSDDLHSELEIHLDLNALHAMTLVDTPGLQTVDKKGGDTEGTIIAVKSKTDILLWLVDANRGSIPDEDLIELKKFADVVDHPMIILNQIDKLAPKERTVVQERICKQLDDLFGKGKYMFYPYSAKVIYTNRPAVIKRKEAIGKLTKGFSEALDNGSYTLRSLGSKNSVLIAGFQGPLVSAIDMASEQDTKSKVSEPDLLRKREEVLNSLNDVIKDRPNLMFRYNLQISQLKDEIESFDKSISKLKKRLDITLADEKERILKLFERGATEFEKNVKEIYTELNNEIIHAFNSSMIENIHIRETGFFRSFKGKVRIRFDFEPNELIISKTKSITSVAQKLTDVFTDYGVGVDILCKFERNVLNLVDALLREALMDLKSLLNHTNPTTDENITIETGTGNHQYFLNLILAYFEILVTNDVLWKFCDSVFLQEMRTDIERYFSNFEKIIAP